jgi:hypothetical protein
MFYYTQYVDSTIDLQTELITFSISTSFYGYLHFMSRGDKSLCLTKILK